MVLVVVVLWMVLGFRRCSGLCGLGGLGVWWFRGVEVKVVWRLRWCGGLGGMVV